MPNPRGYAKKAKSPYRWSNYSAKRTCFKKKQEAIASRKYAEPEPNLEFETNYGKLPNYIMKVFDRFMKILWLKCIF